MFDRYDPAAFEAKWRDRWKEADLFRTREEPGREKFYGLDFFPYPSGAGLSVGHCRNYIPTDVLCRMKYMQGHNVLHPMGFDAFGLPAENEAIKQKSHPAPMIDKYAATYRRQMDLVGISYDWARSFKSCDSDYYKWTQWIFELLYKRGLAYRKLAEVNWCPKDKTALANEEVVAGLCERCGTPVEKRAIPQWFFKITAYAQRLIDDLDTIDWPEGIKAQQRNWIGRSEGVEFEMKIDLAAAGGSGPDETGFEVVGKEKPLTFRVFTTRIDTIFGMTFCVMAPEHPAVATLLEKADEHHRAAMEAYIQEAKTLSDAARQDAGREKTGVNTGFSAINPANGERVPLFIADYVLIGYGTGAIMAVPAHDQRDFDFAQKFGVPVRAVIRPDADYLRTHWKSEDFNEELALEHYIGNVRTYEQVWEAKDGVLIQSGEYSGQPVKEAQTKLGEWMEALEIGERKVNYKLRDWLISRQRYWGCPIPVVHSADGEEHLVSENALPVLLPEVEHYEPGDDGSSPLAGITEFVNATDNDGRLGRRETDTMGGFACSSWYFLRFCDPHNPDKGWDPERVKYWMPVDCYVGGAEHAVMHLLYARFWTKVLFDEGLVPVSEPFRRLENQGQVLGYTPYRKPREGEMLDVGEEGILCSFEEAKGLPQEDLDWRWVRMSKSKGNVVTPDEAVEQFGADALRVYELFVAPFNADVEWKNEGMQGACRFLSRIFKFSADFKPRYQENWKQQITAECAPKVRRWTHQTIQKVTSDIEKFAFNTSVSTLMIYVNNLYDAIKEPASPELDLALSEAVETLILLLAPIAPHSADELWSQLGRSGFTYQCDWPIAQDRLAVEDEVNIAVQVNGKLRDNLTLAKGSTQEQALQAALASAKVVAHTDGKTVRKVIYVPDKLLNIVAG